jgi:hypothetical protein
MRIVKLLPFVKRMLEVGLDPGMKEIVIVRQEFIATVFLSVAEPFFAVNCKSPE